MEVRLYKQFMQVLAIFYAVQIAMDVSRRYRLPEVGYGSRLHDRSMCSGCRILGAFAGGALCGWSQTGLRGNNRTAR